MGSMAAAERQQRHSWRPRLQQLGVVDAGAVGRDRCRKEMMLVVSGAAAAVGEEQGDEGAAVAEGETRHLGGRILTTPVSTAGIVIVGLLLSLQLAPVAQMRRRGGGRLVQVAGVEDG